MRDEGDVRLHAAHRPRARRHFRRVAVLERAVAVEIGMAQRMMRRLDGPAARAGAAGDPAHEERRRDEVPGEERHAGEQDRGGEAARVAHVRRGELAQMLGHCAGEFGKPRRSGVWVLIHRRIGRGRRVAEVRGNIDDPGPATGARRAREQGVDEGRGHSVRGGREHRGLARPGEPLQGLPLRAEAQIGVGAGQVREGARHGLPRRTLRHHGRELEARVRGDQAQELPGYVAAAAEHHRRNPAAHCAAAAGSPSASITRSPRAAPLLMALQAGTPIWVVMISTPTWLSVAGPVTTHGSI